MSLQALELQTAQESTHTSLSSRQVLQGFSAEHARALEQRLSTFFQGQQEESRLTQARRILGESAATLSDEDLDVKVTSFQYLIDC